MRAKFLTICAGALLAAACGGKDQADASANADTGLTAAAISSNDVTAIDAVTGEAANMAADMDFTNAPANAAAPSGKGSTGPTASSGAARESASTPGRPSEPPEESAEPATQPANSTE